LDRDGVLIEDVHFLTKADQIRLLPGAARAIRRLQPSFLIIAVTNQSGIARGLLTEEDLMDIHSELFRLLAMEEVTVDALYYCPHLPEGVIPSYDVLCDCRKPNPGMLLRASKDFGIDLSRSYLVGDMPRDIKAGDAAGVKSILLNEAGDLADERDVGNKAGGNSVVARDLEEAAGLILAAAAGVDPTLASIRRGSVPTDSEVKRGLACQ